MRHILPLLRLGVLIHFSPCNDRMLDCVRRPTRGVKNKKEKTPVTQSIIIRECESVCILYLNIHVYYIYIFYLLMR